MSHLPLDPENPDIKPQDIVAFLTDKMQMVEFRMQFYELLQENPAYPLLLLEMENPELLRILEAYGRYSQPDGDLFCKIAQNVMDNAEEMIDEGGYPQWEEHILAWLVAGTEIAELDEKYRMEQTLLLLEDMLRENAIHLPEKMGIDLEANPQGIERMMEQWQSDPRWDYEGWAHMLCFDGIQFLDPIDVYEGR